MGLNYLSNSGGCSNSTLLGNLSAFAVRPLS